MTVVNDVDLAKAILACSTLVKSVKWIGERDRTLSPGFYADLERYCKDLRLRWERDYGYGAISATDEFLKEFLWHQS